MPKAYWVVTYRSVSDPQKLAAYAELAVAATTPFGARILSRGNPAVVHEDGLKAVRGLSGARIVGHETAHLCNQGLAHQRILACLWTSLRSRAGSEIFPAGVLALNSSGQNCDSCQGVP